MQKNWIGRSEGAEVTFKIDGFEKGICRSTPPVRIRSSCHLMVLAPEHPLWGTDRRYGVSGGSGSIYGEKLQHLQRDIDRVLRL